MKINMTGAGWFSQLLGSCYISVNQFRNLLGRITHSDTKRKPCLEPTCFPPRYIGGLCRSFILLFLNCSIFYFFFLSEIKINQWLWWMEVQHISHEGQMLLKCNWLFYRQKKKKDTNRGKYMNALSLCAFWFHLIINKIVFF